MCGKGRQIFLVLLTSNPALHVDKLFAGIDTFTKLNDKYLLQVLLVAVCPMFLQLSLLHSI